MQKYHSQVEKKEAKNKNKEEKVVEEAPIIGQESIPQMDEKKEVRRKKGKALVEDEVPCMQKKSISIFDELSVSR